MGAYDDLEKLKSLMVEAKDVDLFSSEGDAGTFQQLLTQTLNKVEAQRLRYSEIAADRLRQSQQAADQATAMSVVGSLALNVLQGMNMKQRQYNDEMVRVAAEKKAQAAEERKEAREAAATSRKSKRKRR